MPKKLKSIARLSLLVLAGTVLGVNIYLWNARTLTGNALPMPFGYGAAVVLSGSMEPEIMVDDLILVKPQPAYAMDDVVVYQSGSLLVVHRIVDLADGMVTTKGDANNAEDTPIAVSQIKGKVIASIPRVGTAVRLLKTPAATIILLAAAVLTIELPFRREKEKDAEELERIKEEIRRLKAEQE